MSSVTKLQDKRERRSVTSCYHGRKISGSQQSFLIEAPIRFVERWKKSMGYRFGPECNHARKSHICQFFFPAIFVEIQEFGSHRF